MEGDNNLANGSSGNPASSESKSGSLVWSIIAIVIVVVLGYLLFNGGSKEETINNNTEGAVQMQESNDSMNTQSDSSDVESIEADMEATNFNSLEVEME